MEYAQYALHIFKEKYTTLFKEYKYDQMCALHTVQVNVFYCPLPLVDQVDKIGQYLRFVEYAVPLL